MLASHPPMHSKSSSHSRQLSNPTALPAVKLAPESGSALPAGARSSGWASSGTPAGNGPLEHGIALLIGSNAQSGRAPMSAKQRPAQPAFIRIGDDRDKDKPRTQHRQGHPSSVLSHPGSTRPGLSTAAQTDPLSRKPVQSRMRQQGAAVTASATPLAAAALLTTQSATHCCSHNVCAAPATQAADVAADVALDCTDALQQISDTHQLDTPAAAATAASGAPACVTLSDAAAQQLEGVSPTLPQSAAAGSAASESAAAGSAALGFTATETPAAPGSAATETLAASGSAVIPLVTLLQSSEDAAASAPRAMLPTSRRKRKGPRAAKPQEPVKAEHSWQDLLGPDDTGKPEVPASTLPAGTLFRKIYC